MVLKTFILTAILSVSVSLSAIAGSQKEDISVSQLLENAKKDIINIKFSDAEQTIHNALRKAKSNFGEHSLHYADALSLQGYLYSKTFQFPKAAKSIDRALEIASDIDSNSRIYGKVLYRKAELCFDKQDYTNSEKFAAPALEILRKNCLPYDEDLLNIRGLSALLSLATNNMNEGEKEIKDLLPIIEREYGNNFLYILLHATLGSICAEKGDFESAVSILEEDISLSKKLWGDKHWIHSMIYNDLAAIYANNDRLEEAESLLNKSLELSKEIFGESNINYIRGLIGLSVFHEAMGNYYKALGSIIKAGDLSESLLGDSSYSFIASVNECSINLFKLKKNKEALEASTLVHETLTKYCLSQKPEFVEIVVTTNLIFLLCGESSAALEEKLIENLICLKSTFGERNRVYLNVLSGLCAHYMQYKDYKKCLVYADIYYNSLLTHKAEATSTFLIAATIKGVTHYKLKQWKEAERAFAQALETAKLLMRTNLPFMSDQERVIYWLSLSPPLYNIVNFAWAAHQGGYQSPGMGILMYNYNLFIGSLLLNYYTDIQKAIINSNDDELISFWQEQKELKRIGSDDVEGIEELDKQLSLRSKSYRDYQNDFSVKWDDIKRILSEDEAAIEIVAISSSATSEKYYIALIIRNNYSAPEIVHIGKEEVIKNLIKVQPYNGADLYSLFFQPLEKHLQGVKQIYLSTVGSTSSISFAAMKNKNEYLMDRYSIVNLLSTRDIFKLKESQQQLGNSIVLFGGADFGLAREELAKPENVTFLMRGQGFDYLPGSKKEVLDIGKILSTNNWKVATYIDDKASKKQFQMLSSSSPDVIHISTHGYYFQNSENKNDKQNISFKASDNPMIRSGLLFSGANTAWNSLSESKSADNGVLTGDDILSMDLSNTKLVVLSACNTALGDIDYYEGVFGLQRAFKMAGVGSILVSLWEIPDSETVLFMTEFYRHIATATSIRSAFEHTMTKMRRKYPENPKAWAGFVLID